MDQHLPAAGIPDRYREILDDIWALEQQELRREAAALRRTAARAYSRAWDERCARELEELARRVRLVAAVAGIDGAAPEPGARTSSPRTDRAVVVLGRLRLSPLLPWGRWLSTDPH